MNDATVIENAEFLLGLVKRKLAFLDGMMAAAQDKGDQRCLAILNGHREAAERLRDDTLAHLATCYANTEPEP